MDNALAQCSNFANGKIGTPKEILDTPKENPITPKVTTRRIEEFFASKATKGRAEELKF
jgi:hypothetical protein